MARQKHTPNNSFDSCARHAAGMGTAFSCKSTAEYKNLPGLSGPNGWRPKVHCLYRAEPAFTENRPQCFQHGDYHIGNMMIENGKLVVIDFDRYDFGDPWEEFNRIVWCAQRRPYLRPAWLTGILTARFRRSSGNCSLCISAAICFLPCLGRFLLASMRLPQC